MLNVMRENLRHLKWILWLTALAMVAYLGAYFSCDSGAGVAGNWAVRIDGNAGDTVSTADGWTKDPGAPIDVGGELYTLYTRAGATLLVDNDVDQSAISLVF